MKWHRPDDLNGNPVTQWSIIAYNHRNTPLPTRIFTSTATTYVYPDLSNSREYTFTVAAKNRKGWSSPSARSKPVKIGTPAETRDAQGGHAGRGRNGDVEDAAGQRRVREGRTS